MNLDCFERGFPTRVSRQSGLAVVENGDRWWNYLPISKLEIVNWQHLVPQIIRSPLLQRIRELHIDGWIFSERDEEQVIDLVNQLDLPLIQFVKVRTYEPSDAIEKAGQKKFGERFVYEFRQIER